MNDKVKVLAVKISELIAIIGLEKPDPDKIISYFSGIIGGLKITNDFNIENHIAEYFTRFMKNFGLSDKLKSFRKRNPTSSILLDLGQTLRDLIEKTYEFHMEQIRIDRLSKGTHEMASIL